MRDAQHELGVEGHGGGDLERPFSAIGKLARRLVALIRQTDLLEKALRLAIERFQAPYGTPEVKARAQASLQGDPNNMKALYQLGRLLARTGRRAEGAELLGRLAELQKPPPLLGEGPGRGGRRPDR